MQFCQLDRITELVPGEKLVAVKNLSLSEDYLQDHFPRFPVMPGVLMLEAMFQAGMFLIYATQDFQHSSVVLKESKQVKFGDFVCRTPNPMILGADRRFRRLWVQTINMLCFPTPIYGILW